MSKTFDYPAAWRAFWGRWRDAHSTLRCPGGRCPGGCGANAKDDLAAIQDVRRNKALTRDYAMRIKYLLDSEREREKRYAPIKERIRAEVSADEQALRAARERGPDALRRVHMEIAQRRLSEESLRG